MNACNSWSGCVLADAVKWQMNYEYLIGRTIPATFDIIYFIGWTPDPSQAPAAERVCLRLIVLCVPLPDFLQRKRAILKTLVAMATFSHGAGYGGTKQAISTLEQVECL